MATWSTGGVAPGATQSWTWNNASPSTGAFFAGLSPSGATASTPCELQVYFLPAANVLAFLAGKPPPDLVHR